ncbi:uncharacterized protein JCM10292_006533 [Rhodotorula paludigena]|uniref:uncharacterized protein n=1 Tax=Rhodotorula paludigena TaxID=86838 RepID=UPI003171FCBA
MDNVDTASLFGLLDELEVSLKDLALCGPAVASLVKRTCTLLRTADRSASDTACRLTTNLLRLADDKLNSYPYKDVPLHWRRLYTDAALLGALARLLQPVMDAHERRASLREAVRQLDLAIVIAGAPGDGRENMALRLIASAQKQLSSLQPEEQHEQVRPTKRRRISRDDPALPDSRPSPRAPPYIHRPLAERTALPAFVLPSSSPLRCEPLIVRGGAADWPAVADPATRWSSLAYLRQVAGEGRVVPVEVGGDYTKEGWGQRVMDFHELLDALESNEAQPREPGARAPPPEVVLRDSPPDYGNGASSSGQTSSSSILYLAQHSLFRQFPSLLSDILIPDLVYSAPDTDGTGAPYDSPATEDGYILNAWLGPAGTKSAAHTDPWWNCYVQVAGSKWLWVAPPSCSSAMSAFGSGSAAPAASSTCIASPGPEASASDEHDQRGSAQAEQFMSNTSSLDVTVPPLQSALATPSAPGDAPPSLLSTGQERGEDGYYSRAWLEQVEPHARQAVLHEGDVLVMPPRWWHAMVSLETSFSVSIWF